MANYEIRAYAKNKGVCLWQIANALNVSEATITRLFRNELPESKAAEIKSVIDRIAADRA